MLVDDADGGFLSPDADALDVVRGLSQLLELVVENVGSLNGGLSMEFGREGDLEENILHNVRPIRTLELEFLALEEDIVEAPSLSGQNRRQTLLALLNHEG